MSDPRIDQSQSRYIFTLGGTTIHDINKENSRNHASNLVEVLVIHEANKAHDFTKKRNMKCSRSSFKQERS